MGSGSGPDTGYTAHDGCNNGWVETEFPSANCGSVLLSMTKSAYGTCHGIYDLQYQAASVSWTVAPKDCQTCDEVCTGLDQVCDASHLGPILTESEVTRTAEKAGFKCTNFYRETWHGLSGMGPSSVCAQACAFTTGTPVGRHLALGGLHAAISSNSHFLHISCRKS